MIHLNRDPMDLDGIVLGMAHCPCLVNGHCPCRVTTVVWKRSIVRYMWEASGFNWDPAINSNWHLWQAELFHALTAFHMHHTRWDINLCAAATELSLANDPVRLQSSWASTAMDASFLYMLDELRMHLIYCRIILKDNIIISTYR